MLTSFRGQSALRIYIAICSVIVSLVFLGRVFTTSAADLMRFQFNPNHVDDLPLLIHGATGLGFILLAGLQILPAMRRRFPRWHAKAGKIAIPLGFIGALSGIALVLVHPNLSSDLLRFGRLGAGLFWAGALALAVLYLRRGDYKRHGRWMLRAYAIVLPALTLVFVGIPMVLIWGEEATAPAFEVIQVIAWAAHLAVAEWLIRRKNSFKGDPETALAA